MLGHVFGATALAVSTTLTVFMGGLALGSHLGGKWAPKLKRPLLGFAVLETSVGLYGLLVPGLLKLMPSIQKALSLDFGDGIWGYALFRFVLVALILILPTTAMGATLPILAEGAVKRSSHLASMTGRLYAANTFGAVLGAFVAGFYLIPRLGIERTVYLAAAIDLIVAGLVLALWRYAQGDGLLLRRRALPESPDEVLARVGALEPIVVTPIQRQLALYGFALSGAAALAMEVLWSRAVGVVIGASTYSFTLILTTFLVGLAVGAQLMSRWIDRLSDPVRWLAWIEVLVGASAILATMAIDKLPFWLHATARTYGVTMTHIYITNFAMTASVTMPSTLALGAVMPLVVRIISTTPGEQHAGPVVGRAYALNTLGAIFGSFLAGFVMLPVLGVEVGLFVASSISVALGVALALTLRSARGGILGVAAFAAVMMFVGPRWDKRSWTAGLFRMYLAKSVYDRGWAPSAKIIYHRDGVASTVTVDEQLRGGSVSLKVNGKVDASDVGDMPTQVLSGLLPLMVHPDPKDILVIGYGSGVTPGAVLSAPIRRLDLVEIEDAVYEASNTHFSHVNGKPFEDPRTHPVVDDGRNFLLTRARDYDVIISEPSNPWMTGAASLFTTDFFRIAQKRLRKGGVFLQWLQLYELAPQNIHALIRTFQSVFPHVLIFTPDPSSNDTLLIGSLEPVRLDRKRVEATFAKPKLAKELKRAEVKGPDDFYGLFLLGSEEIAKFVGPGPLNTDDNALIEFSAPQDLLTYATKDARLPFLEGVEGKRLTLLPKYFDGWTHNAEGLRSLAWRLLEQGHRKDAAIFAKEAVQKGAEMALFDRVVKYIEGDDAEPVVIANEDTQGDEKYARVAYAMMDGKDKDAITLFEMDQKLHEKSLAHRFLYAFLCYRDERYLDADHLMEKILADEAFVKKYPTALYYAGRVSTYRGRWDEAVARLKRFDQVKTKASD